MVAVSKRRAVRSGHHFSPLAQLELLHFAGGGLRDFLENHVTRAFVSRQILAAEFY
jgi:hypothetical protein